MKPKKTTQDVLKPARLPDEADKPAKATPSSEPELEDEDTEAVPPSPETAEVEEEKARERAADDGMPDEDAL